MCNCFCNNDYIGTAKANGNPNKQIFIKIYLFILVICIFNTFFHMNLFVSLIRFIMMEQIYLLFTLQVLVSCSTFWNRETILYFCCFKLSWHKYHCCRNVSHHSLTCCLFTGPWFWLTGRVNAACKGTPLW